MHTPSSASGLTLALFGLTLALPSLAEAAFIEDSKADLKLRNFYFNHDFRQDDAPQSKRDEWAQGLILDYRSGFTEGTVGLGVDALGVYGLKLDSGPERQGTGLLPIGDHKAPDDYSRLGATAKARISQSVLRVGTLIPKLPVVQPSDGRLLPQTFRGAQLTSTDIEDLTLNAGRLTSNTLRNVSGHEDIEVAGKGIKGARPSDRFNFAGGQYTWDRNLSTGYHYGGLDNNYRQHIVNVIHTLPISASQSFKSDLRFADASKDGNTNVDNRAYGARFTYQLQGHSFGAAWQRMKGETGYPRLNGSDPFLVNFVMISSDFANPEERSWQARYDFDFASVGIPGLSFMTRYVKGDNFRYSNGAKGTEWERNTDIRYAFQSNALKNLDVAWRNGTYRSNGNGNDIDQNRLIVNYSLPLL
jgi:hypothetical protein